MKQNRRDLDFITDADKAGFKTYIKERVKVLENGCWQWQLTKIAMDTVDRFIKGRGFMHIGYRITYLKEIYPKE